MLTEFLTYRASLEEKNKGKLYFVYSYIRPRPLSSPVITVRSL